MSKIPIKSKRSPPINIGRKIYNWGLQTFTSTATYNKDRCIVIYLKYRKEFLALKTATLNRITPNKIYQELIKKHSNLLSKIRVIEALALDDNSKIRRIVKLGTDNIKSLPYVNMDKIESNKMFDFAFCCPSEIDCKRVIDVDYTAEIITAIGDYDFDRKMRNRGQHYMLYNKLETITSNIHENFNASNASNASNSILTDNAEIENSSEVEGNNVNDKFIVKSTREAYNINVCYFKYINTDDIPQTSGTVANTEDSYKIYYIYTKKRDDSLNKSCNAHLYHYIKKKVYMSPYVEYLIKYIRKSSKDLRVVSTSIRTISGGKKRTRTRIRTRTNNKATLAKIAKRLNINTTKKTVRQLKYAIKNVNLSKLSVIQLKVYARFYKIKGCSKYTSQKKLSDYITKYNML